MFCEVRHRLSRYFNIEIEHVITRTHIILYTIYIRVICKFSYK